jgi:hypothetical protein
MQTARVLENAGKGVQSVLFDTLKRLDVFAAWRGRHAVAQLLTQALHDKSKGLSPFLCLDFKNFDATIPVEVINRLFGVIKSWFTRESAAQIDFYATAFNRAGVFVPNAHLQERKGGLPSGSVCTSVLGSFANLWALAYGTSVCKANIVFATVCGDDGVIRCRGLRGGYAKLAQVIEQDLGMVLSMDKCHISDHDVHFLQDVHTRDYMIDGLCVGVRPIMKAWAGMSSFEKIDDDRWNKYIDSFRFLQQIEHCYHHPKFKNLARWLLAKDQYLAVALDAIRRNDVEYLDHVQDVLSHQDRAAYNKVSVGALSGCAAVKYLLEEVKSSC